MSKNESGNSTIVREGGNKVQSAPTTVKQGSNLPTFQTPPPPPPKKK
ncbi:hypothetical protein [Pedobacter ginsenosidimutans]|nr:hypothetical protein [Pedobacter ginsenosidimutans]